jgi:hypothetical protein
MASLTSRADARDLDAPPPPAVEKWSISNDLNRKVVIEGWDGSVFALAPFEQREVDGDAVERYGLDCWSGKFSAKKVDPESDSEFSKTLMAFGLGIWFAVAWAIAAAFVGTPTWWIYGWGALGLLFVVARVTDLSQARKRETEQSLGEAFLTWMRRWGGQQAHLALSLFIGVVLPGAAIFFAADALNLIHLLRSTTSSGNAEASHAVVLTLIGRIMQVVFVATASLTPALLFFLFDREHLESLCSRFMRQIVRFDPTVDTRQDVEAKYRTLMDEAYGRDLHGRILPGRRSPLLLATLVIALGWTFTLLHGDVLIISERGITALFEPRQSAVSFAFLGAYFYGINAVLRGYVRKDLRPKTYSTLTVRIFVVVILAWVLELLWQGTTLFVLAFLCGIVPETALVLIKEAFRTRLRGIGTRLSLLDEEPDPLTKLEGIDLYDRARLFDEGVTNVQGLAAHDIVELMLQTRIPVPRILDWLDQAILYLHAGPRTSNGDANGRDATLATLRAYGIRTATDLDNAFHFAKERNELDPLAQVINSSKGTKPARLQVIKDTLEDEEWMANLRCWRRLENVTPGPLELRVLDLPRR